MSRTPKFRFVQLGNIFLMSGDFDPTAGDGLFAPVGSVFWHENGTVYLKEEGINTVWVLGAEGIMTADAAGRAKIAANFFDPTTLLSAFADACFGADSATRALFADGIWNAAKLATDAVSTVKIEALAVTAAKLAAASVTPAKKDAASYFELAEDFALPASGTLPPPHAKDVLNDATGDYLDDAVAGVYSLATAVTSEAEAAQLTHGDQLMLDPSKGLIFEARVRVNFPGAAITADERWVVGLASAHASAEDSLDAVVSNVWFRGEGANLNIFVEGDDGAIDTNDLDSTFDYADNTWVLLKIDMTDKAAVVFSVNGVAFGTTVNVGSLSSSTPLQPIFCYQRDAGTEINLLQVDWYRVYQTR